jgi:hypothetical protein
MERRRAITTAAAASLTLLAGAAGIALNSGIVDGGDDNVGRISPVSTASQPPLAVQVDEPATTVAANGTPDVRATASAPVTTSGSSSYQDDDHDEGGEGADHDERDDERSEYEYEGADDDD